MSRTGWSAANYMRYAGAVVSAAPLTISAWAYSSVSTATKQIMVGLYKSTATGNVDAFRMLLDASAVNAVASNASTSGEAFSTAGPATNTWFHAAAVFTSATSRASFLNGGNKGTDTTNITPASLDRTSIGLRDNVSGDQAFASGGTGYIADVAIWNVALTDAEVLSLSKGFSPLKVRPSGLVFYCPLLGITPEPNLINAATAPTIQGTLTAGPHAPLIMPRRSLIIP